MCRHRKFQQNEILKEILIMVSLGIRKERGGGGLQRKYFETRHVRHSLLSKILYIAEDATPPKARASFQSWIERKSICTIPFLDRW